VLYAPAAAPSAQPPNEFNLAEQLDRGAHRRVRAGRVDQPPRELGLERRERGGRVGRGAQARVEATRERGVDRRQLGVVVAQLVGRDAQQRRRPPRDGSASRRRPRWRRSDTAWSASADRPRARRARGTRRGPCARRAGPAPAVRRPCSSTGARRTAAARRWERPRRSGSRRPRVYVRFVQDGTRWRP
jgi:hypothetical protein